MCIGASQSEGEATAFPLTGHERVATGANAAHGSALRRALPPVRVTMATPGSGRAASAGVVEDHAEGDQVLGVRER